MRSIEIITHVFGGNLPHYSEHLKWQASSLLHNPPQCDVTLTVFWAGADEDQPTARVIDQIERRTFIDSSSDRMFFFNPQTMLRQRLFRRAIGRHMRSQESTADILWYCDADYYFGPGCLDFVSDHVLDDGGLYYPSHYWINNDHRTGDLALEAAADIKWPEVNPADFHQRRQSLAIGGMQILGRETAKQIGYLGGTKWTRPVDPNIPFPCFRDDSRWRRANFVGSAIAIPIPSLYRIRHSISSLTKVTDGAEH